ncbi:MAG: hypothetical protein KIS96_07770 [Bauldia sp.]|nr:hypothetical protein [Bauldia sp.]
MTLSDIVRRRLETEQRIKAVKSEITAREAEIVRLKGVLDDLDTTVSVIRDILGLPTDEPEKTAPKPDSHRRSDGSELRKPEGTPTVPQMITLLLRDAVREGKDGMSPTDLLEGVQVRWWPTAVPTDVGPAAWRMCKRGELRSPRKGWYSLPNDEGSELFAAEPSKSAGAMPTG